MNPPSNHRGPKPLAPTTTAFLHWVKRPRTGWLVWLTAPAAVAGLVLVAHTQQVGFTRGTNFKYPILYWPEKNGVR